MAQQMSKQLLGTWRMLSWTRELVGGSERSHAFGPSPQGTITYTPDGRVVVLVVNRPRPMPSQVPPTPEEKIRLFDTVFAYSGTYSVEAACVVHHIDTSWNELWTGSHQIRICSLAGDRLTYRSPPAPDPLDGRDCVYTVEFEKVRPPASLAT